jgi:hypothetical protein
LSRTYGAIHRSAPVEATRQIPIARDRINLIKCHGRQAFVVMALKGHSPAVRRPATMSSRRSLSALVRPTDSVLVMAALFAIGLVVTRLRRLSLIVA